MAHGICLPAVCCAVAALVWLPAASTAQMLDGPEEGVYELQPLLRDDSPTPQFFGRGGPPGRHRGLGHPLQRESWLYRPFSAGWFMGVMQGGPLIDDWLGQKQGFVGGYRLGWDQDYYWGAEMRFTFASVELYDSRRAIDAQYEMDTDDGFAPHDPYRLRFNQRRDADFFQWDVDLLHYPWGDSQW